MGLYALAANITILIHFLFILFVVLGGIFVLRYPKLAWLHAPAALWGAWIEFSGGICPLTPLENKFRLLAGKRPYQGDFIEHHLLPIIYPEHLTQGLQLIFGATVIIINVLLYGLAIYRWKKKKVPIINLDTNPH